jgi:hypothetical protein
MPKTKLGYFSEAELLHNLKLETNLSFYSEADILNIVKPET